MVSIVTPTAIKILVPPKNWVTWYGMPRHWPSSIGMRAMITRNEAPAKVMRLIVLCKKSLVALPGRMPGM